MTYHQKKYAKKIPESLKAFLTFQRLMFTVSERIIINDSLANFTNPLVIFTIYLTITKLYSKEPNFGYNYSQSIIIQLAILYFINFTLHYGILLLLLFFYGNFSENAFKVCHEDTILNFLSSLFFTVKCNEKGNVILENCFVTCWN